jgi:hypothetical protein
VLPSVLVVDDYMRISNAESPDPWLVMVSRVSHARLFQNRGLGDDDPIP